MELGAVAISAKTGRTKTTAVSAHHVHGRQFAALPSKNSVNSYDYPARTNILQEASYVSMYVDVATSK